jgi:type I restriction enzyme, S subunit
MNKNAPDMNDLTPEGWTTVTLEEISRKIVDGSHNPPKKSDQGLPMLSARNISNGRIDFDEPHRLITQDDFQIENKRTDIEPNDVLLTIVGAIGRSAVVPEAVRAFTLQRSVAVIKIIQVNPYFLSYYFQSPNVQVDLLNRAKGTAQKGVYLKTLKQFKAPLPPLKEQRRIVTKIEELTDRTRKAREALEDVPQLIEQFRRSVLAAAFRGDLTADWREQNPDVEPAEKLLERIRVERRQRWEAAELEKMRGKGKEPGNDLWKKKYNECPLPKFSDLPLIPRSWAWSGFSQLGEINRGKSKHRPRKDPILFGGDYPFIQTGDVSRANGEIKAFSKTYNEVGLKQSCLWPKNTLCITIAANIAETGILTFESCFPDSIVGFIADPKICEVRFVELFIRTVKGKLERFAPATAQKNINLEILKDLAIPVPPLEEQRKILTLVDYQFSIIHRLEEIWQQNYQDFEKVDRAILAKAFRGQLVPQDPTDEPASQLLQRIRTEREKLTPKEKPVKKQKRC